MNFGGTDYLALLGVTALVVSLLPMRLKWFPLLAANFIFLSLNTSLWWLILVPLGTSYLAALFFDSRWSRAKSFVLWPALALNLTPMLIFKWEPAADGILPLGISFYTLVLTGYLLDVYWQRRTAERHLGIFVAFAAFFPTITAGPIERSTHLLPQLRHLVTPAPMAVSEGILLILIGLLKKYVIAANLAPITAAVFKDPSQFHGLEVWSTVILARFQLYYDFSGYTDIAIGSALMLGTQISPNFNRPFAARSITEFWRRWHISLSSWMRDYVFLPLVGGIGAWTGLYPLIILTFIILGLWHGFTLNFALFGLLQGVLIALQDKNSKKWASLPVPLQVSLTFLFLVCLPMILFRTVNLNQAAETGRALFNFTGAPQNIGPWSRSILLLAFFEAFAYRNVVRPFFPRIIRLPMFKRYLVYVALVLALILLGQFEIPFDFAYRNF